MNTVLGLGATLWDPANTGFFMRHPWLVYVLRPGSLIKYDTPDGESTVNVQHINSLGYRGPEFSAEKPAGVFRIICMGGSTTFGMNEPYEERTYPRLLETYLNERFERPRFEVINAGVHGWSTGENLINLHARLLDLSPDMILSMEGVNDTFAMRNPEEGKSDYSNFRLILDYREPSAWLKPILRWSVAAKLLYVRTNNVCVDICGLTVKRAPAGFDELAQLNKATGRYFRKNIRTMVDIAQANGIAVGLITMAHDEWHPSINLCAEIVRQVAREKKTALIDFEAQAMGHKEFFFQDKVHLLPPGNEALARSVAETIATAPIPSLGGRLVLRSSNRRY